MNADLTLALANRDQPQAVFDALMRHTDALVGVKLFTLMVLDRERQLAQRIYSNQEASYPTGGEKPIEQNAWTAQVEGRGETFVANSIEEIAAVFGDWELIKSLGCESCLNVPVDIGGHIVGTLNCLNVAGHFDADKVQTADALKLPGALAFLLHAQRRGRSL